MREGKLSNLWGEKGLVPIDTLHGYMALCYLTLLSQSCTLKICHLGIAWLPLTRGRRFWDRSKCLRVKRTTGGAQVLGAPYTLAHAQANHKFRTILNKGRPVPHNYDQRCTNVRKTVFRTS